MTIATFTTARDLLVTAQADTQTSQEACERIAAAVAMVAPYDASAVTTTDPDTHLPSGGVVSGFDASECVPFWDNELLDPDFNKYNDLAKSIEPVATLAESTDGDLERSPRYQKLYAASGASDELRAVFMLGSSCLAIAAFVRCDGQTYSPTEVRDVSNLLGPAVQLLRGTLRHSGEALTQHGPIVVILDADGSVVSMSADAEGILEDLRINVDSDLPGTIMIAAARARSKRTSSRLTTRLRGSSGRWVRIHVSPMEGDGGTVSITIDAAAPSDLVPILLDAYGLSDRETDIVLQLCRGIGTKEIASELGISAHTVRDHLKSIFDKADVSSRGELVARLFSDHVLERFHTSVGRI